MKMQSNKKVVFFWNPRIDYQLFGTHLASGIEIQMGRWAKTFIIHGWETYGITEEKFEYDAKGIHFIPIRVSALLSKIHLSIICEFLWTFLVLAKYKPELVLFRGASRKLYCLSIICNILHIKLCFFGASDVNFIPGKDLIDKSERNTNIYRKAIKHIKYFVAQNNVQSANLKRYYGKDSIIIPNIWSDPITKSNPDKRYDAIWVSHLRPLKRAEWFVKTAEAMPNKRFLIVGGSYDDDYFTKIKEMCESVSNISFIGPKSEQEVNMLIDQSRVFVCTSEYEGFPNTFLQSWAKSVPIISTVDPSGIIEAYDLGLFIKDIEDLITALNSILNDEAQYQKTTSAIYDYFIENYDTVKRYKELTDYLQ